MAVPPPLNPLALEKADLRRTLRAARSRFIAGTEAETRATMLADLHGHVLAALTGGFAGAGILAGFTAHRGEPDVLPLLGLLARADRNSRRAALPRMDAAGMVFAAWSPGEPLTAGPLGIVEPDRGAAIVAPAVLLVPLIGFDRAGVRLGQGGGHYDRWFGAHPRATRIGIAWSVQEVTRLPSEPWDVALDAIATEREWITP